MTYSAFGPRKITVYCHGFLSTGTKGDVNDDGSIDVRDVIQCVNHILGFFPLEDPDKEWAADCNGPPGRCDGDGVKNALDVLKIVNIILGSDKCLSLKQVYYNSFESEQDISGWFFNEPGYLTNDPAPLNGDYSINITGGCMQPTASFNFPYQPDDGNYILSLWGKFDGDGGGSVVLTTDQQSQELPESVIHIDSRDWTWYSTDESVFCPKTECLRIEIWHGGIMFPGSIFIDGLKVEKIE